MKRVKHCASKPPEGKDFHKGSSEPSRSLPRERRDQITPEDLAADRWFWGRWGTPVFKAMLDAEGAVNARRV